MWMEEGGSEACPDLGQALLDGRFFELVPSCSGKGTCLNQTCVCEPGWTGRSDFLNTEGLDCQINEAVVRYLWIASVGVSGLLWISTIPRVFQRIKAFSALRDRKREQGIQLRFWSNPTMLSMFFFEVVCIPASTLYVIIKLFRPEERLGITYAATICFFVAHLGFFLSIFCFQPFLLGTLLQASSSLHVLVPINFSFAAYMTVVTVLCSMIPLVSLLINGSELNNSTRIAYVCYFGIYGATLYSYVLQAFYILYKVKRLLKVQNSPDQRMRRVKRAISQFQVQGIVHGLTLGSIYIAFACWPFLWNKHDYWLPVVWTAGTVIWKYLAFTAVPQANQTLRPDDVIPSPQDLEEDFFLSSMAARPSTTYLNNVKNTTYEGSIYLEHPSSSVVPSRIEDAAEEEEEQGVAVSSHSSSSSHSGDIPSI